MARDYFGPNDVAKDVIERAWQEYWDICESEGMTAEGDENDPEVWSDMRKAFIKEFKFVMRSMTKYRGNFDED